MSGGPRKNARIAFQGKVRTRVLLTALALGSVCRWDAAHAEEREDEGFSVQWLDRPHAYMSRRVYLISDRIDRFFDETGDEEAGESRVKVVADTAIRERQSTRVKARADVRLDLPGLERRWNLFLQNVDLREDGIGDRDEEDRAAAGLRVLLRQTPLTRAHVDGGVRGSGGPALFGRARWRWQQTWDPHLARATQFFVWHSRDGFKETTRLEYEYSLASCYLFQLRGDVTWSEFDPGVGWTQRVVLARVLERRYGWALFGGASGVTRPRDVMERTRAGVRHRTRLYRDWLFVDVEPYVEFEREHKFKGRGVLALRMEMLFRGIGE